jgi:MFS family permease
MLKRFRQTYHEFPGSFWTLGLASFIDHLGGALVFPFFALYFTQKFNVSMVEVGVVFAIFAFMSLLGSGMGGAMADRLGRRSTLVFGLSASAFGSICMAFVTDFNLVYGLAAFVGLFASAGFPAQQAMVADLLPEEKHAEGYGILRVIVNLSVVIGPALGGLLAGIFSFSFLFILDAITSFIMVAIVLMKLPETQPESNPDKPQESLLETLGGYRKAMLDTTFSAFVLISVLFTTVYHQVNTTLSVYLRDVHNIPPQGYGALLSMNAAMVVLLQFWFTRRSGRFPPMLVMAAGALLGGIGFTLFGLGSTVAIFILAMAIITTGEMLAVPVSQAVVARFSPENMRGRYMAIFGFTWIIGEGIGPLAAGWIMDNHDPRWVWYACGIASILVVSGYLWLHAAAKERLNPNS